MIPPGWRRPAQTGGAAATRPGLHYDGFMSDRVVVMHEKRIRGVLSGDDITQAKIANLMTGVDEGEAA